ncbi:Fe-S cluster assembly sulfur transfer protein SufU [Thioalkalivibrio paradoxus]|uniref:Nitrogen fixation protein NifU n=1 Tax=Thioalkalivibrio paradoxus ARh 1 TaxID=713585 RepID=W0DPP6_9GAMM|nr:SUF system NifU family Fe-S cluster assembly protein [Thioalkalivibrio paradoxus]AHE98978.1 nitrogen fixation protein NifU [Thioalkalivibrio paradoxus ARh 1]
MSDLDDLYQELILDHKRHPRNFREMPDATRAVDGHNPLCGDQLRLFVKLADGRVEDVSFVGVGCAISMASASMLTEAVKGRTVDEARHLFERVHELLTGDPAQADPAELGSLGALAGVHEYPMRVKCATLSWHTLDTALAGDEDSVTTE